jgi:type IV secretion system protein VirB6
MEMAYFALIYAWVDDRINTFRDNFMQNAMSVVASVAVVLFTAWIMVQGFRILTGQSREPLMGLVVNASRNTLILIAAGTMALGGSSIQTFFTDTMASGINGMVTGNNDKPEKVIDKNLAYTADRDGPPLRVRRGSTTVNSADNVASAGRASLIAMLGVAGPPMTAAAMLLMYKVALALFIGLGPIFIMCLMFKVTEQMFWSWLKYGLGTLFSMAVLSFMVSIVLELTVRVAAALWTGNALSAWLRWTFQQRGPDDPGDAARGHRVVDDDAADLCAADGGGVLRGDDGAVCNECAGQWWDEPQ